MTLDIMKKEELKVHLATASTPGAIARYMDACISQYGWEETDKIIRDAVGHR